MKSKNIKKGGVRGLILLLPLLLLSMASCVKELAVNDPNTFPNVPEGMVRIGLYTSSGDYQIPATRAGQADETTVGNTPWVFVFKDLDSDKTFVEAVQAMYNDSEGKSYVTLTQTDEKRMLLIIANPPSNFYKGSSETNATFDQDNVAAWLTGKTYDEAQKMLTTTLTKTNQTTVPYVLSTIPMSGTLSLDKIDAGTVINKTGVDGGAALDLYRIVAKVTVHNSASGFVLDGATVAGASRQGYLFPAGAVTAAGGGATPLTTEYLTTTTGDGVTGIAPAEPQTVGTGSTKNNPIYIYESESKQTTVIVKGTYNGTPGYYRLAFKSKNNADITDGTVMAVERNKHYKFEIVSVTGPGYSTVGEAIAAPPSNMIATIDVTDLSSHDIIDNGQYYLGVSNSEFIAYSDDALTGVVAVTVTTNATAAKIGTLGTNTITAFPATLKVLQTSLDLSGGETTLIFSSFPTTVTSGTITIKLGNLQKTIQVTRRAPLAPEASATKFEGGYVVGKIESQGTGGEGWLSLSLDGTTPAGSEVTCPDGAGSIYLMATRNYVSDRRAEDIYLYRHNERGRLKLSIEQKGSNYYPAYPGVIGYDPVSKTLNLNGVGVMVYFKYGGIIGMYSGNLSTDPAWNGASSIAFNPTSISNFTNYRTSFPIGAESAGTYSTIGNFNVFHTLAGGKDGNGDPCRFIKADGTGMTAAAVKEALDGGTIPDQGIWRLPTHAENGQVAFSPANNVYETQASPSEATLRYGQTFSGLNRGDSHQEGWNFLPAAGYRDVVYGTQYSSYGKYWSSSKITSTTGRYLDFDASAFYTVINSFQGAGKTVRCVRQ